MKTRWLFPTNQHLLTHCSQPEAASAFSRFHHVAAARAEAESAAPHDSSHTGCYFLIKVNAGHADSPFLLKETFIPLTITGKKNRFFYAISRISAKKIFTLTNRSEMQRYAQADDASKPEIMPHQKSQNVLRCSLYTSAFDAGDNVPC
ncbi:MAG: hypothetical protein ACLT35_07060 [Christensenellales bacterium]